MTFANLLKLLNCHGIVYEKFTSQSVKVFSCANSEEFDFIEVIGNIVYLNGSLDFNIWEYLGY